MGERSRFLVTLSTDIAASDEAIAVSIKKGVDEHVTLCSEVTPLRKSDGLLSEMGYSSAQSIQSTIDGLINQRSVLLRELQSAHDHMHSMMLQMNEMQNVQHLKILNRIGEFLVDR